MIKWPHKKILSHGQSPFDGARSACWLFTTSLEVAPAERVKWISPLPIVILSTMAWTTPRFCSMGIFGQCNQVGSVRLYPVLLPEQHIDGVTFQPSTKFLRIEE